MDAKHTLDDDLDEETIVAPSKAEILADELEGRTTSGPTRFSASPITFRMTPIDLAHVDALAAHAGKGRGYMLRMLIEVGIEEVENRLPPKVRRKVNRDWNERAKDLMRGPTEEEEEV